MLCLDCQKPKNEHIRRECPTKRPTLASSSVLCLRLATGRAGTKGCPTCCGAGLQGTARTSIMGREQPWGSNPISICGRATRLCCGKASPGEPSLACVEVGDCPSRSCSVTSEELDDSAVVCGSPVCGGGKGNAMTALTALTAACLADECGSCQSTSVGLVYTVDVAGSRDQLSAATVD